MNRLAAVCAFLPAFALARAEARAADGGADAIDAVVLPAPTACTLRATRGGDTVRLELAPGIPYTEVNDPDTAEVRVPVARAPVPVGVRVKKGRIALEGVVPAAGIPLHASHPFVIGELFVSLVDSTLHVTDATEGELGLEATLADSTLKVVKGVDRRQRARRACGDVRFGYGQFDPFDAVGGTGLNDDGRLKVGSPVPVSLTPGAAPRARLVPRPSVSESMTVLERQPGWARIAVILDDLLLVGWVPAASVRPPPRSSKIGDAYGVGGLGLVGPPKKKPQLTCGHDVRLIAAAGGQRRIVGTIGSGVLMEAPPGDARLAVVSVDGLTPTKGAQFLVRRADLDGCKAAPAP